MYGNGKKIEMILKCEMTCLGFALKDLKYKG